MKTFNLQNEESLKLFSIALSEQLQSNYNICLGQSKLLHAIAKAHGYNNWHVMKAKISGPCGDGKKDLADYLLNSQDSQTIYHVIAKISGLLDGGESHDRSWALLGLEALRLTADIYCMLRDAGKLPLIKSVMDLISLEFLWDRICFNPEISNVDATKEIPGMINEYLRSLPGWNAREAENALLNGVGDRIFEQHSLRTMQYYHNLRILDVNDNNFYLFDINSSKDEFGDKLSMFFESKILVGISPESKIHVQRTELIEDLLKSIVEACSAAGVGIDDKLVNVRIDKFGYPGERVLIQRVTWN